MTVTVKPLHQIYMHTSSGAKYYPFAPSPEMIDIEVIAHHLACRARYNGATQHPVHPERLIYSVAEHSVYVSLYIEEELGLDVTTQLEGLLHDGSEAFNGDLIRPLKHSVEFSAPFRRVETANEKVIAQRFGLPYPMSPAVKIADEAVTTAEIMQIVPRIKNENWESGKLHDDRRVAPYQIQMLLPYDAKSMFLDRFTKLMSRKREAV